MGRVDVLSATTCSSSQPAPSLRGGPACLASPQHEGIDDGGARRAEIRDRVAAACEDWGIFQVVDHGVDAALVADMARLARDFFALPPEDKLRFDMSGGKKGGFIVSSHLQVHADTRV